MKSKIFLTLGVLILIFLGDYFKVQDYCTFKCSRALDEVFLWWFIFISIFFIFLVLLSFASKRIISKWWSFTRISGPVLLVLSTIVASGVFHNPQGIWQDMFDVPVQISLDILFTLGSLVQIIRGYYQK